MQCQPETPSLPVTASVLGGHDSDSRRPFKLAGPRPGALRLRVGASPGPGPGGPGPPELPVPVGREAAGPKAAGGSCGGCPGPGLRP
jgi:hypothetical protein